MLKSVISIPLDIREMESEKEYAQWCFREERIMDQMSDYNIINVINRIKRKEKWNRILGTFRIPFKINVQKDKDIYSSYLSEYFLRLGKVYESDGLEKMDYDLYRGMKPEGFILSWETYQEEHEKVLQSKKKKKNSLVARYFRKFFT